MKKGRCGCTFFRVASDMLSYIDDGKPTVVYVTGDMAGETDSPLYGLFDISDTLTGNLAVSLLFGLIVSTVPTLVVIPVVYYGVMRNRVEWIRTGTG